MTTPRPLDELLSDLRDLAATPTLYGQETHGELHEDVLAYLASIDSDAVPIARCPEHGLHGSRDRCYVCGGPVEQIPMARLR